MAWSTVRPPFLKDWHALEQLTDATGLCYTLESKTLRFIFTVIGNILKSQDFHSFHRG